MHLLALLCPCCGRGYFVLDRVAAELVAQRGDHLHLRGVVLAGREPREQRGGDRGQRHGVVDGGLHRPAALAGVLRVAAQLLQVLVLVQRVDGEVEQPGADDRALLPGAEDLAHVGDGVDLLQQLPALGVGLHHRVLDAVVDHLREVARADLARVHARRTSPSGLRASKIGWTLATFSASPPYISA